MEKQLEGTQRVQDDVKQSGWQVVDSSWQQDATRSGERSCEATWQGAEDDQGCILL